MQRFRELQENVRVASAARLRPALPDLRDRQALNSSGRQDALPAPAPIPAPSKPTPGLSSGPRNVRTLVVQLVEVLKITNISIIDQKFSMDFYIELRIDGGARDADLSAADAAFPIGADGKPTFKPSALWYLAQVDFNNAEQFTCQDARAVSSGDDLVLSARYCGTFLEPMELEEFPFDVQSLTCSLAVNCRTNGPIPVVIAIDPAAKLHIAMEEKYFPLHSEWRLERAVRCSCELVGTEGRRFPTVNIEAVMHRRPTYYVVNVCGPMFIFALMGNFQVWACTVGGSGL